MNNVVPNKNGDTTLDEPVEMNDATANKAVKQVLLSGLENLKKLAEK
jgi:hypothetical protein